MPAFRAGVHGAPETCPLLSLVWAWRGGIKAQDLMIHPWGKDRFVPAPEEQPDGAVGSRRPHFAERNTEVAGGGERHRGHGTSSGRALAGWERSFFISASPSLEGAAAQGAKGNSHPDGRLTFPAERPLPQSGASRKPGTAAGRGGRPHRPENAQPFRKPELLPYQENT